MAVKTKTKRPAKKSAAKPKSAARKTAAKKRVAVTHHSEHQNADEIAGETEVGPVQESVRNIPNNIPSEPITPEATNGHDFKDADVIASYETLALLMTAFDNAGVSVDETQWRTLSEADQHIAARWLNTRRTGVKNPVPSCLQLFANAELRAEIAPYQEDQQRIRRVIMPCKFGKHSETKPDGDDSEPKIKMTLHVPVTELSAATADYLFGHKRAHIEFDRRPVNTWDQTALPGVGQTYSVIADISGFSRNRTHWKFSFFVNMSLLSIEEAYSLWKELGSCRVESMGDIPDDERSDSENPENDDSDDDDEPDDVRRPTLFKDDDEGDTPEVQPLEFLIPIKTPNAFSGAFAWRKGDRWFAIVELTCDAASEDGEAIEINDHLQFVPAGDGYVSLANAIEAELGKVLDLATQVDTPAEVVNELRDELKRLVTGGAPHPMPEGEGDEE